MIVPLSLSNSGKRYHLNVYIFHHTMLTTLQLVYFLATPHGMWDPLQPGIEPTHPAVGSMVPSITGWPGKSTTYLNLKLPKFFLVSFFCNIPTVTLTFLRIFLLVIFFPISVQFSSDIGTYNSVKSEFPL